MSLIKTIFISLYYISSHFEMNKILTFLYSSMKTCKKWHNNSSVLSSYTVRAAHPGPSLRKRKGPRWQVGDHAVVFPGYCRTIFRFVISFQCLNTSFRDILQKCQSRSLRRCRRTLEASHSHSTAPNSFCLLIIVYTIDSFLLFDISILSGLSLLLLSFCYQR